MKNPLRISIRIKILTALLFVVTGVVGVIVLMMANLFHLDKKAYITDLVSLVSVSTAEESRSLLLGYEERLRVCSRIIASEDLDRETRTALLEQLFDDFPELVGVTLEDEDGEIAAAFNGGTLEAAGLSRADLIRFRETNPLPLERIAGGEVHVRNSTVSADLPTLTLALAQPGAADGSKRIVSAEIQLDGLLRLAARSEGFDVYVTDGNGEYLVHTRLAHVTRHRKEPTADRARAAMWAPLATKVTWWSWGWIFLARRPPK